jgi:uncharacterized protein (DUF1697 family)
MDALRSLFESLGFTSVETFIASGNVTFESESADAAALEQRIEQHLARSLGYPVATFLRTPAEIAASAAHDLLQVDPEADPRQTLSVGFLKSPPPPAALPALAAFTSDVDEFRIIGRELYWLCRIRISDSKFAAVRLDKVLQSPSTFRNITTVKKLALKFPP